MMYFFYQCKKKRNRLFLLPIMIIIFNGFLTEASFGQVRQPFTQRTSIFDPTRKIYNVKGDFAMIGNTNLSLKTYTSTGTNDNPMIFVDVDGNPTTLNSSSATLGFSTENGANPSCSNIIYAGLYWTGRTDINASPDSWVTGGTAANKTNNSTTNGYTLTINQTGSGSNWVANYIFTPTGGGNVITFTYTSTSNTAGSVSVKVGSGALVNIPSSFSSLTATFTNAYEIAGSSLVITALKKATGNTINGNFYVTVVTGGTFLDKHRVLLKYGTDSYQTVTANSTDIYYSTGGGVANSYNIYAAYADVTTYVKSHGVGEYTIANIALKEGNPDQIGLFGGWGLIVVYENSKMKWRDVTIFDGYAYVDYTNTAYDLDISGFKAVQNGDVNVTIGVMAGEGDRGRTGDYFAVKNRVTNSFDNLGHPDPISTEAQTKANFFCSTISTGGNARNPNLENNTGLDIYKIALPNSDKSLITNNQTSTTFRYGSSQDTYSIFCIAMSVDAYVPEIQALNSVSSIAGIPPGTTSITVYPGQELEYSLEIYNRGTEGVNNEIITIPIPYTASLMTYSSTVSFSPAVNSLVHDASLGLTGSLVWNIGNIPVPASPDVLLAKLTYKLKVTTDCFILSNPNCIPSVTVDGNVSGVGGTSGTTLNQSFISGYSQSGVCVGEPIRESIVVNINRDSFVSSNCVGTPTVKDFPFCNLASGTISITSVSGGFPKGSRFYKDDTKTVEYTITNPFPTTAGTSSYIAVPPGISTCSFNFTITVKNITSVPLVSNVSYCQNAGASPLSATPSVPGYNLYYYYSITDIAPKASLTPSTSATGTTTYYVAEGESGSCISPNKNPLVVTVNSLPVTQITYKPVSCFGGNDGEIKVKGNGGTGTYIFSKDNGTNYTSGYQTEYTFGGLIAGSYTVRIKDTNECVSEP